MPLKLDSVNLTSRGNFFRGENFFPRGGKKFQKFFGGEFPPPKGGKKNPVVDPNWICYTSPFGGCNILMKKKGHRSTVILKMSYANIET